MRKILSIICLLCCLLCFPRAAIGDTDIYHTPTKEQLSESEALKVATAFWLELCSVDISEEIDAGNYTALFGPGYQWGANTEDDCWIIEINMSADISIQPWIIIHGTSGHVVYWQYEDKEAKISYFGLLPNETNISVDEAIEVAKEDFRTAASLDETDIDELYIRASFGYAQYFVALADTEYDDYPVWSITIRSSNYASPSFPQMGHYYVSAIDRAVLKVDITHNPMFR